MTGEWWPSVNAALNATSALLLTCGFVAIRTKRLTWHVRCMVGALLVSSVFFVSYLLYHARVGAVAFTGSGWIRPVYFGILLSHTLLAVLIVPLALRTVFLGSRQRFTEHVAIARWTFPLWLYVCVSGVVVYWMLYHYQR